MKIRCDRQEFLKGIQYVQNIISSRATLPILSNILLKAEQNRLTLAGTDLEVGVVCHIPVTIEEEGGITLPAKKLILVATDGRRLALIEKGLDTPVMEELEVIVPTKAVQELNRILKAQGDVKLFRKENQILFDLGEVSLISRLVEGEFPNYQQVIPNEGKEKLLVDRQEFLQATRRASLLTTQESQSVKFDLLKDKVVVSKSSSELGEAREELDAQYRGKEFSIGFNPHYLIDGLKNIEEKEVQLELEGPEKPGVIRTKGRFLYIVLPMQLS